MDGQVVLLLINRLSSWPAISKLSGGFPASELPQHRSSPGSFFPLLLASTQSHIHHLHLWFPPIVFRLPTTAPIPALATSHAHLTPASVAVLRRQNATNASPARAAYDMQLSATMALARGACDLVDLARSSRLMCIPHQRRLQALCLALVQCRKGLRERSAMATR